MKKLLIFLAMGAILVPAVVFSRSPVTPPVPHLINYQGMFTDNSDNPITDTVNITFEIYNDPTSTDPSDKLWGETQLNVPVINGIFNVTLGSVNPIDLNFYEEGEYWLDVSVGEGHFPRVRFISVAFAYRAQMADTANYAVQVESYPHNHDTDYVNVIGPDSIRDTTSDSYALRVNAYGADGRGLRIGTKGGSDIWGSDGIEIYATGHWADGIYIDTAGDAGIEMEDIATHGIQMEGIHKDGIHMEDVDSNGIYMDAVKGDGIYIHDVEGDGININDAASMGLIVTLADHGVYVDSTRAGGRGVWVDYTASYGIYLKETGNDGIHVADAGDDGLQVQHADGDGIYVDDAGHYGLYIVDSDDDGIYVHNAGREGIEARGAHGGGELHSLDEDYWALKVHSYNDSTTGKGLFVFGDGEITGNWSKLVPGLSGDGHAFGVFSPDVELIASGTGTLVNGQAQIAFEPEFQEAISSQIPVKVVLTAQGAPSGLLYVESKSNQGFTVQRLEIPDLAIKSDDITFDWIAIGRQKGYEQRPEIVLGEEEWRAGQPADDEEMRAEKLRHQEDLKQDALFHQQMLEKQTRREAERREREKQRQEHERGELE